MWVMTILAEQAIEKAMQEGVFDNLPGMGKPLLLEDDSNVPPDCRMAYKILRNSGHVPPEVAEMKEYDSLVEALSTCRDEQERYRQIRKLNFLVTKLNMRRKVPINMEEQQHYYDKVVSRVSLDGEKNEK